MSLTTFSSPATDCKIKGPYLPVGDIDWECSTHKIDCELIHARRFGTKDLRREDFFCPVGDPDGRIS